MPMEARLHHNPCSLSLFWPFRVIPFCLLTRNPSGNKQFDLLLGEGRPAAFGNKSHARTNRPDFATEGCKYSPKKMTVIAARSGELVEQYRNLAVIGITLSLHIYPAELALWSVLPCLTRTVKNLRVVTWPCQRCVPPIVDENQGVSVTSSVKRESSTMFVSVTQQPQAATFHAVRVVQKRLVKNQRMRANVANAKRDNHGHGANNNSDASLELWRLGLARATAATKLTHAAGLHSAPRLAPSSL